jgi:hypothetical protein
MTELDKTIKYYEKIVLQLSVTITDYINGGKLLGLKEQEDLYTTRVERRVVVEFLEKLYEIKFEIENNQP